MVQFEAPPLDRVFAALADGTRRAVLERLERGPLGTSELAAAHAMSLPGFMKHLAVLEAAGLIARTKEGRVARCELVAAPLQDAAAWIQRYRSFWNGQLDALGHYLTPPEPAPCTPAPSPNPPPSTSDATTPPRPKPSGAPGPTRRR